MTGKNICTIPSVTDLNPQSSRISPSGLESKEPPIVTSSRVKGDTNCISLSHRSRRADCPHRALRYLAYSTDLDFISQKVILIPGLSNGVTCLSRLNISPKNRTPINFSTGKSGCPFFVICLYIRFRPVQSVWCSRIGALLARNTHLGS